MLGHVTKLDVVVLGVAAQHLEGPVGVQAVPLYQDALRLTDQLARVEGDVEPLLAPRLGQRDRRVAGEDRCEGSVVRSEASDPAPVRIDRTDPPVLDRGQLGSEQTRDAPGRDLRGPLGPAPVMREVLGDQRLAMPGGVVARAVAELLLQPIDLPDQWVGLGDGLQPLSGSDEGDADVVGVELTADVADDLVGSRVRRRGGLKGCGELGELERIGFLASGAGSGFVPSWTLRTYAHCPSRH